jgi:hypothetical protein
MFEVSRERLFGTRFVLFGWVTPSLALQKGTLRSIVSQCYTQRVEAIAYSCTNPCACAAIPDKSSTLIPQA